MLGDGLGLLPPVDLSALLQFVATTILIACGFLVLLKNAAPRYFVADTSSEGDAHGYEEARARSSMSTGSGDDGPKGSGRDAGDSGKAKCFMCGNEASKVCARCKDMRYCSLDCQSQHWKLDHKLKCRKKELGSIALVPSRGVHKVLEQPKKILFPYDEFMELYYWEKKVFPPCGLLNCGNSCFANVVLQCLSFTRPLAGYLLDGAHSKACKRNDWCFLCELQLHVQRANKSLQPFSPLNILSRLPNIGSHLGYGKQEDAHEFMRFAIDTMQSVCLDEFGGEKSLHSSTQETSLIQHIFGGHLQSQVICTKCNMVSNRYENMMDLTVEIQGDAESLEDCLDQFTAKEWLDGENKYKCDGCNDYVKAWKQLTVHQAPNILTVTLKRFQSGRFGKLNKRVTFPETLNLGPYMSSSWDGDNLYALYAVVVHLDLLNASFFGHYVCYTKDFSGNWYMIDDCKVMKVELEEVLLQGAYMLLYSRLHVRQPKPSQLAKENVPLPVSSATSQSAISMDSTIIKKLSIDGEADSKNEDMDIDVCDVEEGAGEGSSSPSKDLEGCKTYPVMLSSCGKAKLLEHQLPYQKTRDDCLLKGEKEPSSNISEAHEIITAVDEPIDTHIVSASASSLVQEKLNEKASCVSNGAYCSPHYDGKRTKTLAPVSHATSTLRTETKPLFSRGFLDKPSRKKPPCKINEAQTQNSAVGCDDKCTEFSELGLSIVSGNSELKPYPNALNNGELGVQTENDQIGLSYKDCNNGSICPVSEIVDQTLHNPVTCENSVSRNSKDNDSRSCSIYTTCNFLNKSCVNLQKHVDTQNANLQENGYLNKDSSHSIEISHGNESERPVEICDSYEPLLYENSKNYHSEFDASYISNGFVTELPQQSIYNDGVGKNHIYEAGDSTSRSTDLKTSDSSQFNHNTCQMPVLRIGTYCSLDILSGPHKNNENCMEDDNLMKCRRFSKEISLHGNSGSDLHNHVFCKESGNDKDRPSDSGMPSSSHGFLRKTLDRPQRTDVSKAIATEVGCSIQTKCNGCCDPTQSDLQ